MQPVIQVHPTLPVDLLNRAFHFLRRPEHFALAACVCTGWRDLAYDEKWWKMLWDHTGLGCYNHSRMSYRKLLTEHKIHKWWSHLQQLDPARLHITSAEGIRYQRSAIARSLAGRPHRLLTSREAGGIHITHLPSLQTPLVVKDIPTSEAERIQFGSGDLACILVADNNAALIQAGQLASNMRTSHAEVAGRGNSEPAQLPVIVVAVPDHWVPASRPAQQLQNITGQVPEHVIRIDEFDYTFVEIAKVLRRCVGVSEAVRQVGDKLRRRRQVRLQQILSIWRWRWRMYRLSAISLHLELKGAVTRWREAEREAVRLGGMAIVNRLRASTSSSQESTNSQECQFACVMS